MDVSLGGMARRHADAQDEVARLMNLISAAARHLEVLAGNIPPPNPHTPELMMLAQIMRFEANKAIAVKNGDRT